MLVNQRCPLYGPRETPHNKLIFVYFRRQGNKKWALWRCSPSQRPIHKGPVHVKEILPSKQSPKADQRSCSIGFIGDPRGGVECISLLQNRVIKSKLYERKFFHQSWNISLCRSGDVREHSWIRQRSIKETRGCCNRHRRIGAAEWLQTWWRSNQIYIGENW